MAFSKNHLYPKQSVLTSNFFKALSFAGRIEIILKLQAEGPLCVKDIAKGHPICRATMSGHLKILREAELIIAVERYPYTFYHIHEENVALAEKLFGHFFQLIKAGKT